MLHPEPMRHLSLVLLAADLEETTRAIARTGVLHLLDVRHTMDPLPVVRPYQVGERLARIDGIVRALDGACRELAVRVPDPDTPVEDGALDLETAAARAEELARAAEALRLRAARASDAADAMRRAIRRLHLVAPVGAALLEDAGRLRYVHLVWGLIPDGSLGRLRDDLATVASLVETAGAPGADGKVLVVALVLPQDVAVLERALRRAQWERLDLPAELGGGPDAMMRQAEAALARSADALAAVDDERRAMAARIGPEVQALLARLARERLLIAAQGLMAHAERIALVTGWVPAVLTTRIEQVIRAATGGRCALHWQDPEALSGVRRGRIPVPILLRNPFLVRPFERLVRGFGLPRYGELEPTPIAALAFLTMFGFMFGDVGQGAVLFAVGYFIYRRMFRHRDYAVILMECGVFAVAFGFLYGSVFGVERWLPALWLHPLDDIGTLVRTAILFGIGLLSVGLVLGLANAVRRRDGSIVWGPNGLVAALVYWVAMGLFVRYLVGGPGAVPFGTAVLWLGLPMLLVALKGPVQAIRAARQARRRPDAGDLLALGIEALVDVLDTVVATLSNTATFIRLAAFALAHAGLFLATFAVAETVARAGGTAPAVLVVVAGNVVIIALEGLIVSVQTLRLEYYEFFSKFYSAGGEEYRPLRVGAQSSRA